MKRTNRTMTLAGTTPRKLFGSQLFRDPITILEYSNVLDINKAWRIKSMRCWIKDTLQEMSIPSDCNINIRYQLNTDDIPYSGDWFNAGDNRAICFGTTAYSLNGYAWKPAGAFSGSGVALLNEEVFIKPEHIIQNKLTLGYMGIGPQDVVESASTVGYSLNYLVELEEWDITPVESIIFNIKAKAQDLSS